jgi:ribosomal protein S18 acetylase RimI-like enzyme
VNGITISKATGKDAVTLQVLGKKTFHETFANSNTEEDMASYLENNFTLDKIGAELHNPNSFFYIVYEGREAIGYLKVNHGIAQTELQDDSSLEIERIYLLSDYHGKKIGQILYEKALEVAHQLNKKAIWLGVWEENPRAIKFYEKNGFVAFDKHIFKMGNDEQIDIMMRKKL